MRKSLVRIIAVISLALTNSGWASQNTVLAIDLGLGSTELQNAIAIASSIAELAEPTELFGLVSADDIVRHIIEPSPPSEFIEKLGKMTPLIERSETSNYSIGLERSMAMVKDSASDKRILLIGNSTINTSDPASDSRYSQWGNLILIPDLALQDIQLILILADVSSSADTISAAINASTTNAYYELPTDENSVLELVQTLTREIQLGDTSTIEIADQTQVPDASGGIEETIVVAESPIIPPVETVSNELQNQNGELILATVTPLSEPTVTSETDNANSNTSVTTVPPQSTVATTPSSESREISGTQQPAANTTTFEDNVAVVDGSTTDQALELVAQQEQSADLISLKETETNSSVSLDKQETFTQRSQNNELVTNSTSVEPPAELPVNVDTVITQSESIEPDQPVQATVQTPPADTVVVDATIAKVDISATDSSDNPSTQLEQQINVEPEVSQESSDSMAQPTFIENNRIVLVLLALLAAAGAGLAVVLRKRLKKPTVRQEINTTSGAAAPLDWEGNEVTDADVFDRTPVKPLEKPDQYAKEQPTSSDAALHEDETVVYSAAASDTRTSTIPPVASSPDKVIFDDLPIDVAALEDKTIVKSRDSISDGETAARPPDTNSHDGGFPHDPQNSVATFEDETIAYKEDDITDDRTATIPPDESSTNSGITDDFPSNVFDGSEFTGAQEPADEFDAFEKSINAKKGKEPAE